MRKVHVTSVAVAVATVLAAAQVARAQEADAPVGVEGTAGVEEIIVTAQRREESIQDVPLSVQAFTGETLVEAGVNSVLDLPRLAPNFNAMRGTQTANVRLHRTTLEVPQSRFDRDERALLRPLALQPYRSLLLAAAPTHKASLRQPLPSVERRSLAVYDQIAGSVR